MARSSEANVSQWRASNTNTTSPRPQARPRLRIDEVSLERNEALGGESVFTIGEYLSPRLLVSYGVALFTPDDIITLTYRVSPEVSIRGSAFCLTRRRRGVRCPRSTHRWLLRGRLIRRRGLISRWIVALGVDGSADGERTHDADQL
jgi:hypothetical protein